MNIFVSYTTKDSEVTLHRLNEISIKLRQIGYVYIDIIHNNSQDKQKRVFEELDNSDVIILIISNNVYNSTWVIKETERAYKQFTPIVPFTINEIINSKTETLYIKIHSLSEKYKQINHVLSIEWYCPKFCVNGNRIQL